MFPFVTLPELRLRTLFLTDTSLVVFRKRLGEERFERIFDEFVRQCEKKGLPKGKLEAIDATHIIADVVAIPNTVNLLKEGRERILRAIKKEKKESWLALLIPMPDLAERVKIRNLLDTKPI